MNKKKKNVLITGGAGFIGSHLTDKLVKEDYEVTIFDNLSTGEQKFVNPKAAFVKGDVTNKDQIRKLFQTNFDAVLHIAGCASSIKSFSKPEEDIKTNFLGTVNIVNACLANKITRLLYASSMTVYGKPKKLPINESISCVPISYYGISKYAAERFLLSTAARVDLDFSFNVTAFRMFNVYGPRQSLTNPYQGVMAIFIGDVLRNEPVLIFGDGNQSRDFIYIDDVTAAWTKSINNQKTFGKVFNLGCGQDYSINEIVKTIIKTLGFNEKKYPVIHKKARPGDQRQMCSDINSLKKALNWKPKYDLKKGLSLTLKWAKENA